MRKTVTIVALALAGACGQAWAGPTTPGSGTQNTPKQRHRAPGAYLPTDGAFSDNFDSYAAGSQLAGQGGWLLWDGGVAAQNATIDSSLSSSAPNSALATVETDVVQVHSLTTGKWRAKAKTYMPTGNTTNGFFIMLNTYSNPYVSGGNWSVQITFNGATNLVTSDSFLGQGSLPLIRDQWVEVVVDIDLDPNQNAGGGRLDITYGGQPLNTNAHWKGNVSGQGTGQLAIQCTDLYSQTAGFRWDDVSLAAVVTCYPDCNLDGVLNLGDFGCFSTKFALGDPYADCNGDGILNLGDFGCFSTKFALGCP